jgi:hypothetical protein
MGVPGFSVLAKPKRQAENGKGFVAYAASVIKVMIASPADVAKERQLIRDVIHEWNAIHAEDRKVVLMPIAWETHSSPEMGERPQAIINKQLLRSCDLLVAVFWTRLGSPTGVAASGTVEEINEHLASGKPAMIYFSGVPVRVDSIDADQYERLRTFKEDLRSRGLVDEYEDLTDFRTKFARQLAQRVISNFSRGEPDAEIDLTPAAEEVPALSEAARELLLEATHDAGGAITQIGTMGGMHVQTNRRDFVEQGSVRSAARWRGAVGELQHHGLIEDRAGKGEVFFLTDAGYQVGDLLRSR